MKISYFYFIFRGKNGNSGDSGALCKFCIYAYTKRWVPTHISFNSEIFLLQYFNNSKIIQGRTREALEHQREPFFSQF
jgi:hypothetical protein